MIYAKWFLMLILNQVTNLLSYPLIPIVVLFADENDWLPNWLWYFQTTDNPICGDNGYKTNDAPYKSPTNAWQRYYNKVRWLYRNQLVGFSDAVLSVHYNADTDILSWVGEPRTTNGTPGLSGSCFWKVHRDGKLIGFKYYYIRQWQRWPRKCVRLVLGFKLPQYDLHAENGIASFGFSPSPWIHFGC